MIPSVSVRLAVPSDIPAINPLFEVLDEHHRVEAGRCLPSRDGKGLSVTLLRSLARSMSRQRGGRTRTSAR
jgi:hypothetical protein